MKDVILFMVLGYFILTATVYTVCAIAMIGATLWQGIKEWRRRRAGFGAGSAESSTKSKRN